MILSDLLGQRWQIQEGLLWSRRIPLGGLYSPRFLLIEWSLLGLGALSLLTGTRRQTGVRLATLACGASLWQAFANLKTLLFLNLVYLSLEAPDPDEVEGRSQPTLVLIRGQLILVYVFSGLNKLASGFLDGSALSALFGNMALMRSQPLLPVSLPASLPARPLAWTIVVLELGLPGLLIVRPWIGAAAAMLFHLAMSLALPDIWTFTLVMAAQTVLFIPEGRLP